jgi:psp operon transcriptional activator
MAALFAHDWPGNVRELKNAAERSVYRWLASGETGVVDTIIIDPFQSVDALPIMETKARRSDARKPAAPLGPSDLRQSLEELEKRWTEDALAASGWNQKAAAVRLKLTYDQIRGLIRKHKLRPITPT